MERTADSTTLRGLWWLMARMKIAGCSRPGQGWKRSFFLKAKKEDWRQRSPNVKDKTEGKKPEGEGPDGGQRSLKKNKTAGEEVCRWKNKNESEKAWWRLLNKCQKFGEGCRILQINWWRWMRNPTKKLCQGCYSSRFLLGKWWRMINDGRQRSFIKVGTNEG